MKSYFLRRIPRRFSAQRRSRCRRIFDVYQFHFAISIGRCQCRVIIDGLVRESTVAGILDR